MNEILDDKKLRENQSIEFLRTELARSSPSTKRRVFEKFALAALGSIPWVGGFISAAVSLKMEEGKNHVTDMQTQWLEEHTKKIGRLAETLGDIATRFETLGEQIDERIQSEAYLDLVRKAFRVWDHADTDEKRHYIANIVSNSSGTRLCSDDVIRLFIDWINMYHESHFAVIRKIYQEPGVTRYDTWQKIYGEFPREDSAEADLFKFLIRDLSTGGVIRQARDTTDDGKFLRRHQPRHRGHSPATLESAFEDSKPYVLTELGKQFVHYTMTEVVPRLDNGNESSG